MSEFNERDGDSTAAHAAAVAPIGAPPVAAQPVRASATDGARSRMHRVAIELIRSRNRHLLAEFLTLRRTVA